MQVEPETLRGDTYALHALRARLLPGPALCTHGHRDPLRARTQHDTTTHFIIAVLLPGCIPIRPESTTLVDTRVRGLKTVTNRESGNATG